MTTIQGTVKCGLGVEIRISSTTPFNVTGIDHPVNKFTVTDTTFSVDMTPGNYSIYFNGLSYGPVSLTGTYEFLDLIAGLGNLPPFVEHPVDSGLFTLGEGL